MRLTRDGEKWVEVAWRRGKREIIHLSLHCHHQNDFCIKVGSDESHFNVPVGSDGQSYKTVSTNHNFKRWGLKKEIIYLSLHCHHQNDSRIEMGSDESHFNVSLIVRDKVTRQCSQTKSFLERKESRTRFEPRPFCLPAQRLTARPKPAHHLLVGWSVALRPQKP